MLNLLFNTYVLHEEKYARLQQTDAIVLRRVQYGDCPAQHDGYNCAIFAIAVIFHLAERKALNRHTF
jgi:Ulp1 family protease